jgi:hypothetical protein
MYNKLEPAEKFPQVFYFFPAFQIGCWVNKNIIIALILLFIN